MATDLTVMVEDKPGSMASIGEALGGSGINIEGLCGIGMEGRGIIHLCVQDGAAARKALEGAGITVSDEAEAILGDAVAGASDPGVIISQGQNFGVTIDPTAQVGGAFTTAASGATPAGTGLKVWFNLIGTLARSVQ